ncbi:MAG TPA: acyl-CoA dehydratase activase [Verrucomicrobiae bacterium]|nr:acyl-CoA dehydratase activase [Verrucomicrobiae bacterium]
MAVFVGLDVGSVSAKLAAVWVSGDPASDASAYSSGHFLRAGRGAEQCCGAPVLLSGYRRTYGNPIQTAKDLLAEFQALQPHQEIRGIRVTGSGGRLVAEALNANTENEFKAIACAVGQLYPDVRTVFEIGGESSKYLRLAEEGNPQHATGSNAHTYATGITDYSTSGECAAGTGSFLDQQASRLKYRVEEIGDVVAQAKCAARIAGRCSVFAKSDMIHAQQKGYSTEEVLKGLCEAVSRNFKSNIVRGKAVKPRVALIGAVSQNRGVVQALSEAFRLGPEGLFVPEEYAWIGALGCALLERGQHDEPARNRNNGHFRPHLQLAGEKERDLPPLSLSNVLLLRDHPESSRTEALPKDGEQISTYLGIDVGSVSTNLALLDEHGRLLHGIYLRTSGRPIEVVQEGLQEIDRLFRDRIVVRGVGTTGSGRELIGELVGADTVNDEITAHKTGAIYVHEKLVKNRAGAALEEGEEPGEVDTIFEIGGQDSKFISIDHGVVVDFAMNEACAAGTGSFLEEQAERMDIQIKDEFAAKAMASTAPARLGERCTVFMERDVTGWMSRGSRVGDLAAGLAYSVAMNYLNRVVRDRKIGKVIYFQGGTAYNDAVAAAFSQLLGKRIIVPPHNGIIGAIGMALIAQQVIRAKERVQGRRQVRAFAAAAGSASGSVGTLTLTKPPESISTFRGFDLNRASFETREFVCKACSNYCDMKEITVEGRKTYWGDKCSDKFRKRARTERRPVIDDLMALYDRLLREGYREPAAGEATRGPRVGIPQAMYFHDRFPFWQTYLKGIGLEVVLSGVTDSRIATRGAELSIAEPCFPVQIAHGHVNSLLHGTPERPAVDFVLLPNVMDMEAPESSVASHLCPWNQTLPYVVRSAPELETFADQFLAPTLYFRAGRKHVKRQLAQCFERLGVGRRQSDDAAEAAYLAQTRFTEQLIEEGHQACATLRATGEPAVLLIGRAYNIYDRSGNCDIPRKLRDLYGVNVLPLDFLPLDEHAADDLHPNMFWHSGRRILEAGRFARKHPNMHIIYITNFKCGPDSFIKHYLRDVAKEPFLVLQFDGHGNDAGYLTRCEAYLDSKGLLRCTNTQ